ncbi:MAG: nickel pincer cofactor biosynthesis protein LarB [Acidobacteria bacterium]|nr:nickel pincer cofactor biosynthesis protein LarB [Acidobacteriota bacterium]
MDRAGLEKVLTAIRNRRLSVEAGIERLRILVFGEDLGFAKPDLHRRFRRGFPEVVFAQGKTGAQVVAIVDRMRKAGQPVLVTRVEESTARKLTRRHAGARYHREARAVTLGWRRPARPEPGILVVSAGTSDLPVAEEACLVAELMGNRVERMYDVGVAGLHRLLDRKGGLFRARVIVVVAGMEGALPSVVAGMVAVPVIGVPTSVGYGAHFRGIAPLLAMLNSCAPGVLTVNIDNGFGAGYAAGAINLLGRPG